MQNNYVADAVKDRLFHLEEEKKVLESFLRKESGQIGELKTMPLTFAKPVILKSDAKWDGDFQTWLKFKNIRLKKGDKRYTKFYQRFRRDRKKNGKII